MAVKQSSDNTAVEHTWKRLVMRRGMPCCDDLVPIGKAMNMKAFFIRRAAPETNAVRRI